MFKKLREIGIYISQIEPYLDHPSNLHFTGVIKLKRFMEAHGRRGPDIWVPFVVDETAPVGNDHVDRQFIESKLLYYRYQLYTFLEGSKHD
ncbi:MAG: hypothetical protein QXS54_12195 [Candidatus Methanomethylicaceae archaeon]